MLHGFCAGSRNQQHAPTQPLRSPRGSKTSRCAPRGFYRVACRPRPWPLRPRPFSRRTVNRLWTSSITTPLWSLTYHLDPISDQLIAQPGSLQSIHPNGFRVGRSYIEPTPQRGFNASTDSTAIASGDPPALPVSSDTGITLTILIGQHDVLWSISELRDWPKLAMLACLCDH